MDVRCTNIIPNEDGEYEDPISLSAIPPNRLVHLASGQLQFCYDALELLRYIRVEQNARRQPTLPDNRIILLPVGVEEVRRVARLSYPQRYQMEKDGRQIASFNTQEEAQIYINEEEDWQSLYYYTIADVENDPVLEDLLYPNGVEETPKGPIPGPYFDQEAMDARAVRNQQQEIRVPEVRNNEDLLREGEEDLGSTIAKQVRRREWRCGNKDFIYRWRSNGNGFFDHYQPVPDGYCSSLDIARLRERHEVNDPREWGVGQTLEVQGEKVALDEDSGVPNCSQIGGVNLYDPCRPDLIEEIASRLPRHYLSREDAREIEYRFDRPSRQFFCRNLDDPDQEEYHCTEELRDGLGWEQVEEDPDIIYRRLTLRGSIECATKEEWHSSRRSGEPIPWVECNDDQREYLRSLPGYRGNFFHRLESGEYASAEEQRINDLLDEYVNDEFSDFGDDERDVDRDNGREDDGRFDADEDVDNEESDIDEEAYYGIDRQV